MFLQETDGGARPNVEFSVHPQLFYVSRVAGGITGSAVGVTWLELRCRSYIGVFECSALEGEKFEQTIQMTTCYLSSAYK